MYAVKGTHVPISVIAGLLLLAVALWATLVLAAPGSQAQTAPLFLGPAQGTSSQGSTADTTSFTSQSLSFQPPKRLPRRPAPGSLRPRLHKPCSHIIPSCWLQRGGRLPLYLRSPTRHQRLRGPHRRVADSFGFTHIPPDPIMAAGPNHLMGPDQQPPLAFLVKLATWKRRSTPLSGTRMCSPPWGPCDRPVSDPLGCAFEPQGGL